STACTAAILLMSPTVANGEQAICLLRHEVFQSLSSVRAGALAGRIAGLSLAEPAVSRRLAVSDLVSVLWFLLLFTHRSNSSVAVGNAVRSCVTSSKLLPLTASIAFAPVTHANRRTMVSH